MEGFMAKRKKKVMTPGAQAGKAQMNIFVRLAGCALLVYIIIQLVQTEEFSSGAFWQIAIVILLALAAVGIILLTILEFVRNFKGGAYSPSFYDRDSVTQDNPDSGNPPVIDEESERDE